MTDLSKIPVTVITGFLGSGKTTLIRNLMLNPQGKRLAVLVNEFGTVGVDGEILKSCADENCPAENIMELANGCICCTLREDLLLEVRELAEAGRFDCLLIESTGISEPLPVAETFTFVDEEGRSLSDIAKLDTMVTVVDAVNFLRDYDKANSLQEAGESLGEEDERSVADLLVDQVEFADVLLISKTDLIDEKTLDRLTVVLRTLNTEAEIVPIANGEVSIDQVLETGKFSFERAQQAPGWLKKLRGEHIPETEEYGIASFAYDRRRPFHPKRFHDFLHSPQLHGKLIRSKGYFWLATRPQFAGQWSQAGGIARYGMAGMFWKAIPQNRWPDDEETREFIREKWQEPFGDMRQELVFIGQNLDKDATIAALDACLLSDDELLGGQGVWLTLDDPFPAWEAA